MYPTKLIKLSYIINTEVFMMGLTFEDVLRLIDLIKDHPGYSLSAISFLMLVNFGLILYYRNKIKEK